MVHLLAHPVFTHFYFYSVPHTNLENINLPFHGFVFRQRLFHAVFRVQLRVFTVVNVSTENRISATLLQCHSHWQCSSEARVTFCHVG